MANDRKSEMYADAIFSHFGKQLLRYDFDEYDDFISELEYAIMDNDVMDIPNIDREHAFKLAIQMAADEYDDSVGDAESMDGDFDSGMASAGFGTDEDYGDFGDNDIFGDEDKSKLRLAKPTNGTPPKRYGEEPTSTIRKLKPVSGNAPSGNNLFDSGLVPGNIVMHERFGKGQVLNLEGVGADKKAEIKFDVADN